MGKTLRSEEGERARQGPPEWPREVAVAMEIPLEWDQEAF